jgi:hypothetical protein
VLWKCNALRPGRVPLAENCIKFPLIKLIKIDWRTTRRSMYSNGLTLHAAPHGKTADPGSIVALHTPFQSMLTCMYPISGISIGDWLLEKDDRVTADGIHCQALFGAYTFDIYFSPTVMLQPIERILTNYLPALPINTTPTISVPYSLFVSSTSHW